MAPQMENAAASKRLMQHGSGQLRPVGRSAVSDEPPEVPDSSSLERVPGESREAVWVRLDRSRQQHDPRIFAREVLVHGRGDAELV